MMLLRWRAVEILAAAERPLLLVEAWLAVTLDGWSGLRSAGRARHQSWMADVNFPVTIPVPGTSI